MQRKQPSINSVIQIRIAKNSKGYVERNSYKLCRICGTEEATIEHLLDVCCPWEIEEEEVLHQDGRGELWVKEVMQARRV